MSKRSEHPWATWWFDAQKCVAPGGLVYIYIPGGAYAAGRFIEPGIYRARREGRTYSTAYGTVDLKYVAYWQPSWIFDAQRHKDMIEIKDSVEWEEQDA